MPTFGSFTNTATHPTSAFDFSGVNTANEVATLFTMPEAGEVQSLSCYVAGDGATVTGALAIWDGATAALLAKTNNFTIPAGSHSTSGQTWQTANLATPLFLPSGKTVFLGFWRDPAGSAVWSVTASGHFEAKTLTPSSAPGTFSGHTQDTTWGFTAGQIGVFATYNQTGVWVFDGAAWQRATAVKEYDGAAFQTSTGVFVYDGSGWRQIL